MRQNYAEEMNRLEDRSLKLFEYFTVIWGALLFFVVENIWFQGILSTFFQIFDVQTYKNPELIIPFLSGLFFFLLLLGITLGCLWIFFKESKLTSGNTRMFSDSLKKKTHVINSRFNWAVLTTAGYILYLIYLTFITKDNYLLVLEFLVILSYPLFFMIFYPLLNLIKRKEKFSWTKLFYTLILI